MTVIASTAAHACSLAFARTTAASRRSVLFCLADARAVTVEVVETRAIMSMGI